ncbi:MAG: transketolase, partial [Bryobacteraceae bacterium]
YVVLGDGESAEGSVWEAAHVASYYKLDNLCATIDVNRLGQSQPTMDQHDLESYRARWSAFGWNAIVVDGHDIPALLRAYEEAGETKDRPTIVLARTLKGKGIIGAENLGGHHGKAMDNTEEAVQAIEKRLNGKGGNWKPQKPVQEKKAAGRKPDKWQEFPKAPYAEGKDVATRKAFADALAALGKVSERIVSLDGDVKNSTYTEEFEKEFPKRFFQMYIAEQNMVGSAMGLAAKGEIPFAATFACFLSRAYDFLRMAAISNSNIKLVGTHAGISIGEDGPSQMGLEDLAMTCAEPNYTVLYPSDGVSAWYAIRLAAEHNGPCYIRTSRPKTAILYKQDEPFALGKCKVLRKSEKDQVTVVGAGITVFEALEAYEKLASEGIHIRVVDLFSVQPIDKETLTSSVRETAKRVLIVEDHYAHGGIGDAVLGALEGEGVKARKLAVREIARSGTPEQLLDRYGISAKHIVDGVRSLI